MIKNPAKYYRILLITGLLLLQSFMFAQSGFIPKVYWTFDLPEPDLDRKKMHSFKNDSLLIQNNGLVGSYLTRISSESELTCRTMGKTSTSQTGMTIELLIRAGRGFSGGILFNWKKRASLSLSDKELRVTVSTNGDPLVLRTLMDGPRRLSPGYYSDGNWHHLVLLCDMKKGKMEVYVDGEVHPDLKMTFQKGLSLMPGSSFKLSTRQKSARFSGDMDEVAIYNRALPKILIRQHFQDAMEGKHYSTKVISGRKAITSAIAVKELEERDFPPGYPNVEGNALDQLQNYPWPRFRPGHSLPRNIPWVIDWQRLCPDEEKTGLAVKVQKEMIRNWNYALLLGNVWKARRTLKMKEPGYLTHDFIELANDPEFESIPRMIITNWQQAAPSVLGGASSHPMVQQGGHPREYYLNIKQKKKNQKKKLSFAAPLNFAAQDGLVQQYLVGKIMEQLHDKRIDIVAENGEVQPKPFAAAKIKNDSVLIKHRKKVAPNSSWEGYTSFRKTQFRRAYTAPILSYIDSVNQASGHAKSRLYWYNLSGNRTSGFKYDTAATILPEFRGSRRPMPYFYPQWPKYWRYHKLATAGLNRMIEARRNELAAGDSLMCPIVSPGFTDNMFYKVVDKESIRPGQYLGLLKILAALGADHYAPFMYYNQPKIGLIDYQPGWRTWKLAMPVYAQAVTSRWENLLYKGSLLEGDRKFDGSGKDEFSWYSFNAGGIANYVVIRRAHGQKKYLIAGTCQPNSNFEGSDGLATKVKIKVDGYDLEFMVRRQGSVYLLDMENAQKPVFIQLDGWHEPWDPSWWSRKIKFEAEVWDESTGNPEVKTLCPKGTEDLSDFTTYVSGNQVNLSYHFQPRGGSPGPIQARFRVKNTGNKMAFIKVKLNGEDLGRIKVPSNPGWNWIAPIPDNLQKVKSLSQDKNPGETHKIELTWSNSSIELDRFELTP